MPVNNETSDEIPIAKKRQVHFAEPLEKMENVQAAVKKPNKKKRSSSAVKTKRPAKKPSPVKILAEATKEIFEIIDDGTCYQTLQQAQQNVPAQGSFQNSYNQIPFQPHPPM